MDILGPFQYLKEQFVLQVVSVPFGVEEIQKNMYEK